MTIIDINTSIREYGDSHDMIVMVMGRGSPGSVWSSFQVPFFTKQGYQVITFDNRGSGIFSEVSEAFSLEDMVNDTISVIEKYKKKVFLVGTSLGARIAQEVALLRSDLLRGLFLSAAHARLSPLQKKYAIEHLKIRELLFDHHKSYLAIEILLKNFSSNFFFENQEINDWYEMMLYSIKKPTSGEILQVNIDQHFDRRKVYSDIKVPTLCLAYTEDRVIFPYQVKEVASIIPNAKYKEIENAGHYGYLERPNEFNKILLDFLSSLL